MNDNPQFEQKLGIPQRNPPFDRSRHQFQNQFIFPNPNIERTTKTHHELRQQPKNDYRFFISLSKL